MKNYWKEESIEDKIKNILLEINYINPNHSFGRPFITAYQLAINFEQQYPAVVAKMQLQIGGKGVGTRTSLAQYLAREISRHYDQMKDYLEASFISNEHLTEISFKDNNGQDIISSLTDSGYDLSIFRLRDK